MKKIIKTLIYSLFLILLTNCGTKEFLGFEERKIKLEGKRVSILQENSTENRNNSKATKIILTEKVINNNWKQSYNSPSHVSINFSSDTNLNKFTKITTGKGEGDNSKILAQPVVAENKIFFMDARTNIIAYNIEKNKTEWKYSATKINEDDHNIGGGIAIHKERVIANTPYGEVISLNINSGKVDWITDVISPIRSAPTIYNDKVMSLTLDNKLIVLDIKNGKIVWQHEGVENNTTIVSTPKVAVDDNIIIVPYSNGEFFGLNYSNGFILWKDSLIDLEESDTSNTFTDIDASPVILDNVVIITSAIGKLVALNKKNGKRIWTRDISSTQTPVVNGNSIFAVNNNKELMNLNINNGNIRWATLVNESTKKNYENVWYSPILVNSKLLMVGGKNEILVINAFTGEIEEKYKLPNRPASSPFVVNKKIYLILRNADILTIE